MSADVLAALTEATEGSRELDAAIASSLGRTLEWHIDNGQPVPADGRWPMMPVQLTSWGGEAVPAYTTSLEDALTLVPDEATNGGHRRWVVDIQGLLGEWPIVAVVDVTTGDIARGVQKLTAPLALCIAALRARQAGTP